MKIEKDDAKKLVGKIVEVNSYRVNRAKGIVLRYYPDQHRFWVKLEKPYRTISGKMSNFHTCNAGNVSLQPRTTQH